MIVVLNMAVSPSACGVLGVVIHAYAPYSCIYTCPWVVCMGIGNHRNTHGNAYVKKSIIIFFPLGGKMCFWIII